MSTPETRTIKVHIDEARGGDWVTLYDRRYFAHPIRAEIVEFENGLSAAGHFVRSSNGEVGSNVVGRTVEREVPVVPLPTEVGAIFRAKLKGDVVPYVFMCANEMELPYFVLGDAHGDRFDASEIDPATVELGRIEFIPEGGE